MRKKNIFQPVFLPANQWVQDTEKENGLLERKMFFVFLNNFDLLCHYAGMSQSREV